MIEEGYDIKRARGHILSGLQSFYPNGISGGLIFRDMLAPLFPVMEWVQALQQLEYLIDRGFVENIESVGPRRPRSHKDRLYRLTPAGLDVALGIVSDAAIEREG